MKTKRKGWHLETRVIRGGWPLTEGICSVLPPLVLSTAFRYDSAEAMEEVFAGRQPGFVYSRIGNPTVAAFESRMADLEEGVGAMATASGMAALTLLVLGLAGKGENVVAGNSVFGGTYSLLRDTVSRWGVEVRFVNPGDPGAVRRVCDRGTRLLFVEAIGNPKLDVPNLRALAAVAREQDIPFAVDSTLTTPFLVRPKRLGADLIVHSASKFISGQGNAIGGVLVDAGTYPWDNGRFAHLKPYSKRFGVHAFLAWGRTRLARDLGACLAPFNAFLLGMGLETLGLRMTRHCASALTIADHLAKHRGVEAVRYPGLRLHPDHLQARRQFGNRYGALLTLRLGTQKRCFQFLRRLRLFHCAANIGDSRSLALHPASTIGREFDAPTRRILGMDDDGVRLSIGLESPDDLVEDLDQALQSL